MADAPKAATGTAWKPKSTSNGTSSEIGAFNDSVKSYSVWQFPNELGTDRFPHYVMFYVNENTKATAGTSFTSSSDAPDETKVAGTSSTTTEAGQKIGAVLPGFGAQFKRTTTAIALYMPPGIRTSYNQSYVEGGMNFIGNAILGSADKIANASGTWETIKAGGNAVLGGGEATFRKSTEVWTNAVLNGDDGANVGALTGKVDNPRTEAMFKSTQLRTHQFSFQFIPQTEQESRVIDDIISILKINMHPELQTQAAGNQSSIGLEGSYLITPNHFDIEFYDNTHSMNKMVHRIGTSVLESMEVDYSGTGQWLAFKGTGNPYCITLNMTFKEIKALTRTSITEGY